MKSGKFYVYLRFILSYPMPTILTQGIIAESRPDRFAKDVDVNSKDYHNRMARYCVSSSYNAAYQAFVDQYYTNLNFFWGNQWIDKDEIEVFLKDTSKQSRNRILWTINNVYPKVAQFIGNAMVMDITVRAKSLSTKARTRYDEKLQELLLLTDIANNAPEEIGGEMKDRFGLGNNKKETESIFYNLWQDNYVDTMNGLLSYVAEKNHFKQKQGQLGLHLCLSGMCCLRYMEWNGEFVWRIQRPDTFFWDNAALLSDLSDAGFMGTCEMYDASEIYEKWNPKQDVKEAIQTAVTNSANGSSTSNYIVNGKMGVYDTYWKDSISYKYGYVIDEYGYTQLVRIDFTEEGEKESKYTEKDVLAFDKLNPTQQKVLNGNTKGKKNIVEKWVDIIRYCTFIPREIVGTVLKDVNNKALDIVLDYGIMPYQDTNYYEYASCKFPFKVGTWVYSHGSVYSPISSLIKPQVMCNRITSVMESHINASLPSSLIYDVSSLGAGGEQEFYRNLYEGKAIGLDAKRTGINNAISKTPSTLDVQELSGYSKILDSLEVKMANMTGVNESLLGQSQGSEQLVGVTQLQIQRASLVQEPFYSALVSVYEQAYQSTADVGKRVYADNERELAIAVGDGNIDVVKVTKDMKLEDFRIFIHREADIEKQKAAATQMLMDFAKAGIITADEIADLGGRSTPDEVWSEMRKKQSEKNVAATIAAPQIAQQQQAVQQAQQEQTQQEQADKIDERNQTLYGNQLKKEGMENVAKIHEAGKLILEANKQKSGGR